MRIIKSKEIGFCFGVKNAYKITLDALLQNTSLYTIGPLIHNKHVIKELEGMGVSVISSPYNNIPGFAIIRSHGLSFKERKEYEKKGFTLIDATCPIVFKNQNFAKNYKHLVIIGNEKHAEVKTLLNKSKTTPVISNIEDLKKLNIEINYNAIFQTTFSSKVLEEIKEEIKKLNLKFNFLNDICPVSENRRKEIKELSTKCDAIIIVGDKESENSKALSEIAKGFQKPTFFIENEGEVDKNMLNYEVVGVASGASCPLSLVEKVIQRLNEVSNGKI